MRRYAMFQLKWLVFFVASVLIFSFNYHVLWILYDVVAIALAAYFVWYNDKISLKSYQWFLLVLTLYYFISITVYSGHAFTGLLSIWDTFKHVLIFLLLMRMKDFPVDLSDRLFLKRLYLFFATIFLIQVLFVFYQVKTGVFIDNVTGTFGDGATHSLAYLSILFITLVIVLSRNKLLIILSIFVSIWLNMAAENAGFFVLLPLLLLGFVINTGLKVKYLLMAIPLVPVVIFMLQFPVYNNIPYETVIKNRITGYISASYDESALQSTRFGFLVMAKNYGGWFGNGPGSLSTIYMGKGYDVGAVNPQINISEASHLIAESGLVGLILTILLYASLIWSYFKRRRNKIFAVGLFCSAVFYGALLMTETQIFLLFMILFVFKEFESSLIHQSIDDKQMQDSQMAG